MSPGDFAQNVIVEALDGSKIKYHKSKGSLFGLLATAMRNDIIDAFRSVEHDRTDIKTTLPADNDADELAKRVPSFDESPCPTKSILDCLDEEQYEERVRLALKSEPDLLKVADAAFVGFTHPKEIAELLDISVEELRNMRRKIERRLIQCQLVEPLDLARRNHAAKKNN
jgi:DNA-directed RNA polymerase specialized sigma24 family protein